MATEGRSKVVGVGYEFTWPTVSGSLVNSSLKDYFPLLFIEKKENWPLTDGLNIQSVRGISPSRVVFYDESVGREKGLRLKAVDTCKLR